MNPISKLFSKLPYNHEVVYKGPLDQLLRDMQRVEQADGHKRNWRVKQEDDLLWALTARFTYGQINGLNGGSLGVLLRAFFPMRVRVQILPEGDEQQRIRFFAPIKPDLFFIALVFVFMIAGTAKIQGDWWLPLMLAGLGVFFIRWFWGIYRGQEKDLTASAMEILYKTNLHRKKRRSAGENPENRSDQTRSRRARSRTR